MSIFWKNLTTEELVRALEARKRELEDSYPQSRKAEARRAILALEKEIKRRIKKDRKGHLAPTN